MKKNFIYGIFTVLVATVVMTSCSSDDPNPAPVPITKNNFTLASYTTTENNYPISGPLYVEWKANTDHADDQVSMDTFAGLLRMMGGVILPQVLDTISLSDDGNITASYISKPELKTDSLQKWGSNVFTQQFPSVDKINAFKSTAQPTSSPTGLATYFSTPDEYNKLTVKLNIGSILAAAQANSQSRTSVVAPDPISAIFQQDTKTIKETLNTMLPGLNQLSDESIELLKKWILEGIQFNIKRSSDSSKLILYLDKTTLTPLFKMRNVAGDEQMNDLSVLLIALNSNGKLPEEAGQALMLAQIIGGMWDATETFNLGLELERQSTTLVNK